MGSPARSFPARSDPDNVVLCLLAADEDDDRDVALQIHFTLIQAFCCENDIDILRVSNPGRLAELLLLETDAGPAASEGACTGGPLGPGAVIFRSCLEHCPRRTRMHEDVPIGIWLNKCQG